MAAPLCDATITRACIAAAGRLRGVRARRLEPEQVVRALLGGAGPIVGVEEPAASPVAGAVVAPTLVTFSSPPPLDLREAAWETWPEVIRRQSSWADYVFTKQPLFDPARPLVLAAPGGGGDDAYLDHAASLGTGAPFVCLRGDAFLRRMRCARRRLHDMSCCEFPRDIRSQLSRETSDPGLLKRRLDGNI